MVSKKIPNSEVSLLEGSTVHKIPLVQILIEMEAFTTMSDVLQRHYFLILGTFLMPTIIQAKNQSRRECSVSKE